MEEGLDDLEVSMVTMNDKIGTGYNRMTIKVKRRSFVEEEYLR
jgi:hypothetical protein